jgi:hypothetical protein
LWHNKYEKCGLSKACHGEWVRKAGRRHPAAGRKKQPDTSTCGGSQFPDNSPVMIRYLAQALLVQEKRKFRASSGVMIDYKRQCQSGANHEHDNV